jgi:hypothetical protein
MMDRGAESAASRRSERLLTAIAARRHYAIVLGAAFWILMTARVVLEGGRWTRDGLPVGWDFHVFRSAGTLLVRGLGKSLYDPAFLERTMRESLPGDYPLFVYLNPPHFAALFAPFSALPYALALGIWSAFGMVLLFRSLRLLERARTTTVGSPASARKAAAYALSSYPVVVAAFAGQSSFLSLWLMALASVLALRGRGFASGCAVGALLYKPQLAVGFLVFFAVHRPLRKHAFAGFSLMVALCAVLNLVVSFEASRGYLTLLDELPNVHARYRIALAFTGRAFFELLLPAAPGMAAALGGALSVAGVVGYAFWARREQRVPVLLAGAVWLTLAVTPHASVYEWTLLLVPIALLRGELDERRWVFAAALLFVVSYLSPPLAEAMSKSLGFGVQLAVPALFAVAIYVVRALDATPARA